MLDCDFRTKPVEDRSTSTKKMTKDEVIEKLKNRIQQRDPAFKKFFLDYSKELTGKIHVRDFKKVGEWVSEYFSISFTPGEGQAFKDGQYIFSKGLFPSRQSRPISRYLPTM